MRRHVHPERSLWTRFLAKTSNRACSRSRGVQSEGEGEGPRGVEKLDTKIAKRQQTTTIAMAMSTATATR
jgi:hypothetical protein